MSVELHVDRDYTLEEAMAEAQRCLNCPKPLCRTGCPIENEIPQFIAAMAKGNFGEADEIIRHRSNLPSICGRVCPREKQCEGACVLNRAGKPIHIGQLERFAADFVATYKDVKKIRPIKKDQGKVAVIGSGPAGLAAAGDLAKAGYEVTVFEAQTEAGGVLVFGIPQFRLDKELVRRDIKALEREGVTFVTNTAIGPQKTIDSLFAEGYEAVFAGIGTSRPADITIPGLEKKGVLQAVAFLTLVQLSLNGAIEDGQLPVQEGDEVVVIGGGNVAIDAARTAVRRGAKVTLAYRRGQEQMPALPSEYEEAIAEGVVPSFYSAPHEVVGEAVATALRCERMEPTEDGSLKATGEYFDIPANKVILAIGHQPNDMLLGEGNGLEGDRKGYLLTTEEPYYGMTNREGVFAAGDIVHQPATVVLAMREGKRAAQGMIQYLQAKKANQ